MKRKVHFALVLLILTSFFITLPKPVVAALDFPTTFEGPGIFLPDSPLYFLDELKQTIRLFVAITPETKAKVYSSIAGERFAELRFMLDKQNPAGIEIALRGMSNNLRHASEQLLRAQFEGKDVKEFARTINLSIKTKIAAVDYLIKNTTGVMQEEAKIARASLMESKILVGDALPRHELANEIQADVTALLSMYVEDARRRSEDVSSAVTMLTNHIQDSGENSIKEREALLKKAYYSSSNEEIKKQQYLLSAEKYKQQLLADAVTKTLDKAKQAIAQAQEAAYYFGTAKERIDTIVKIDLQSVPAYATQAVAGVSTTTIKELDLPLGLLAKSVIKANESAASAAAKKKPSPRKK